MIWGLLYDTSSPIFHHHERGKRKMIITKEMAINYILNYVPMDRNAAEKLIREMLCGKLKKVTNGIECIQVHNGYEKTFITGGMF